MTLENLSPALVYNEVHQIILGTDERLERTWMLHVVDYLSTWVMIHLCQPTNGPFCLQVANLEPA